MSNKIITVDSFLNLGTRQSSLYSSLGFQVTQIIPDNWPQLKAASFETSYLPNQSQPNPETLVPNCNRFAPV